MTNFARLQTLVRGTVHTSRRCLTTTSSLSSDFILPKWGLQAVPRVISATGSAQNFLGGVQF